MSSEAAKKAYPKDERIRDVLTQWHIARRQEAFDAGAVEALRHAAELAWRFAKEQQDSKAAAVVRQQREEAGLLIAGRLSDMADDWVVGQ